MHEIGGPRVFYAEVGGAQASSRKTKWYGPGVSQNALELCHLVTTAGTTVSTGQGCPGMHHKETALVGWLGLIWLRHLGFVEIVGQV